MTEENGNGKQPQGAQMHINVTPDGTLFSVPIQVGIPDELMAQVVKQWLFQHPQQMNELIGEALKAKQQELAIIKHLHRSKNN